MDIKEKIEKIKQIIRRLPGINSQEPKFRKLAVFLYSFVIVIWFFAIIILNINYFFDVNEEEVNTNTIISFDEISSFKTDEIQYNISSENIIENKNIGLLMNSPSSMNNYELKKHETIEPKSFENTINIKNTPEQLQLEKIDRIIITDKTFVQSGNIIDTKEIIDLKNNFELNQPVDIPVDSQEIKKSLSFKSVVTEKKQTRPKTRKTENSDLIKTEQPIISSSILQGFENNRIIQNIKVREFNPQNYDALNNLK